MKLGKKKYLNKIALFMVCATVLTGCGAAKGSTDSGPYATKKEDSMEKDQNMMKDEKMMDKSSMKKMNDGLKLDDFKLKDVEGKKVSLSDYKGKKVYMKLWASWCPICLSTMPQTDELAGKKDKGYEVISVVAPNFQNEKSTKDFKEWYKGLGNKNLRVILDEDGNSIAKKLAIRAYPTGVFIGSDGVVTKVQPGHIDENTINMEMGGVK